MCKYQAWLKCLNSHFPNCQYFKICWCVQSWSYHSDRFHYKEPGHHKALQSHQATWLAEDIPDPKLQGLCSLSAPGHPNPCLLSVIGWWSAGSCCQERAGIFLLQWRHNARKMFAVLFSCGHDPFVLPLSQAPALAKHLGWGLSTCWISWAKASIENTWGWSQSWHPQFAVASRVWEFVFILHLNENQEKQCGCAERFAFCHGASVILVCAVHREWTLCFCWWCPISDKVQENFVHLIVFTFPPTLAITVHLISRFINVFSIFIHTDLEGMSKVLPANPSICLHSQIVVYKINNRLFLKSVFEFCHLKNTRQNKSGLWSIQVFMSQV